MRDILALFKDHPSAFAYSVLVHAVLVALLSFSLDWTLKPVGGPQPEVIQAVALDEQRVQQEVEKLKAAENKKQSEAERKLRELEEQARKAEEQRKAEQQQLADLKKQKEQEAKKQEAEKQRLEKLKAEQAALAKKQEAEKKRLAEQEQKRKAEEAARKKAEEERKQAEAEAKKKAEEEKRKAEEAKRKAEEEAKRKAAEAAMQKKLAEEQAALAAEQERRNQTVVDQYVLAIKDRVQRNWIQPPGSRAGLSCVVKVRLIPGGGVASVQIVQSSGDVAFDDSVEKAVYRADPLPLPPPEQGLFERFRELTFRFAPQ